MAEHRWTKAALLAAIVAFTALFTTLLGARYHGLQSYDPRDEAVNNQILHNTAHGRLVFSTVKGDAVFHRHFRPIFVPLAVPYIVHSGPLTYYLTTSLILALGALFAFGLGRSLFGDDRFALLAGLAWLMFPPVHELALGNFDPETIAATFWLGAFYFFHRRLPKPFWLFALLAVCCKETHAPILAAFGVLALIQKRRWTWIAPPIAVGCAWFILAVTTIIPAYTPEFRMVYNRLAGVESPHFWHDFLHSISTDPAAVFAQIFNPEDGYLLGKLLLAGGGAALLSPLSLLPVGSIVIQILLHKDPLPVRQAHMLAGLIPFLFAATLLGIKRVANRWPNNRRLPALLLAGLLGWSLLATALPGPFGPGRTYGEEDYLPTTLFDPEWYAASEVAIAAGPLLEKIPPDAIVMTNERYLLPLSSRAELREFGTQKTLEDFADMDFLLIGLTQPRCPTCTYALPTPHALRLAVQLITSGRFTVLETTEFAVLLQQNSKATPNNLKTQHAIQSLNMVARQSTPDGH